MKETQSYKITSTVTIEIIDEVIRKWRIRKKRGKKEKRNSSNRCLSFGPSARL